MALSAALVDFSAVPPHFAAEEVAAVRGFWAEPGRLTSVASVPERPYQAMTTGEGSEWMHHYYRTRQPGTRLMPTHEPKAANADHTRWDNWITRRQAADYEAAGLEASRLNGERVGTPTEACPPIPEDLKRLVGEPPAFAKAILVRAHVVKFPDFSSLMKEGVQVRRKFPFFRSPQGVDVRSATLRPRELSSVFSRAGLSPKVGKVLSSVASLEGGFGSVNTYDSGYVSVGFVQFASLGSGGGSLGEMMSLYKRTNRKGFNRDFRRYGVDVTEREYVLVLDPDSGQQFVGPGANARIIADKRLTAVFHRAGCVSDDFRVAQAKAAMSRFYPGNVSFTAYLNGTSVRGHLSDVFQSEAGLATLMDRYVNTGNLGSVGAAVEGVMRRYGYTSLEEAAQSERELIEALRYRRDFLAVRHLSQPGSSPVAGATGSAPESVDDLIDFVLEANPVPPAAILPHTPDDPKPADPKPAPAPVEKAAPKLPDTPVDRTPEKSPPATSPEGPKKEQLPPPVKEDDPKKGTGG